MHVFADSDSGLGGGMGVSLTILGHTACVSASRVFNMFLNGMWTVPVSTHWLLIVSDSTRSSLSRDSNLKPAALQISPSVAKLQQIRTKSIAPISLHILVTMVTMSTVMLMVCHTMLMPRQVIITLLLKIIMQTATARDLLLSDPTHLLMSCM